jgi:hypothetical protein
MSQVKAHDDGGAVRDPARLTAVKTAHDPANVFHLNQNLRPAH